MTDTDAIMQDFDSEDENFYFNISAKGDDFWYAVDMLKADIPALERCWSKADELWAVERTRENEDVLRRIFANGECCLLDTG